MNELDDVYAYGRASLLHYARWMAANEYPYLDRPEILEYPTETWAAQDMRKSEVFHFASRHANDDERATFLQEAEFFYQNSVTTLATMDTRGFCRPIALLLGSGFSYDGFRECDDGLPPPQNPNSTWPQKATFVPQKKQALLRAKKILAAGVAVTLCGIGACVAWLLF